MQSGPFDEKLGILWRHLFSSLQKIMQFIRLTTVQASSESMTYLQSLANLQNLLWLIGNRILCWELVALKISIVSQVIECGILEVDSDWLRVRHVLQRQSDDVGDSLWQVLYDVLTFWNAVEHSVRLSVWKESQWQFVDGRTSWTSQGCLGSEEVETVHGLRHAHKGSDEMDGRSCAHQSTLGSRWVPFLGIGAETFLELEGWRSIWEAGTEQEDEKQWHWYWQQAPKRKKGLVLYQRKSLSVILEEKINRKRVILKKKGYF